MAERAYHKDLPGVIPLLKESFEIFQKRSGVLVPLTVIYCLLLTAYHVSNLGLVQLDPRRGPMLSFLIYLVVIAIEIPLANASVLALKDPGLKWREALAKGREFFKPALWILILDGFLVFGGLGLLVVPGIIFSNWFRFSRFTLLYEKERGMNALLLSREYVRGYWGRIFLRATALLLPIEIFQLVLFAMLRGQFSLVYYLIIALVSFFTFPIILIYHFLLYERLKEIKGKIEIESHRSKDMYSAVGCAGYVCFVFVLLLAFLGIAAFLTYNNHLSPYRIAH